MELPTSDRKAINRMGGWSLPIPVFEWVFKNIPEGGTILELGAGMGTQVFASKYEVLSVENDPRFGSLPLPFGVQNMVYAKIAPTPASTKRNQLGWYERETLLGKLPVEYDLLVVDGPNRKVGRSGILDNMDLFQCKATVIIDDVNRPAEMEIADAFSALLGTPKQILTCDVFPYRKTAIIEP